MYVTWFQTTGHGTSGNKGLTFKCPSPLSNGYSASMASIGEWSVVWPQGTERGFVTKTLCSCINHMYNVKGTAQSQANLQSLPDHTLPNMPLIFWSRLSTRLRQLSLGWLACNRALARGPECRGTQPKRVHVTPLLYKLHRLPVSAQVKHKAYYTLGCKSYQG